MAALAIHDWVGAWSVDPGRSSVTVRCKTFWGLMTVKGTFSDVTGGCEVTEAGASGEVRIPVTTLATGIGKRDEHLRQPEFFDLKRFPEIVVAVSAVEPKGQDSAVLRATLTVKGVSRPVEPQATVTELDGGAVKVAASVVLDRSDYGVDGNQLGMVGDDATVSADVVFVRT